MNNTARAVVGTHFADVDIIRFWSKVDRREDDECWPWIAASADRAGYGVFKLHGRSLRAHRVALALSLGIVPDGLLTMHRCDNPPCCNPKHLIVGTSKENTADMLTKGRNNFTPCDSAHFNIGEWRARNLPFKGSSHPMAKLTEKTVRQIKLARANGISGVDCATAFGCSTYTVSNINLGKQWRHVV